MFIGLIRTYGLEMDVAKHLSENYGDRASYGLSAHLPNLSVNTGHSTESHSCLYPIIDTEVHYAVRNEYAQTTIDAIARCTRLSFLNARAALYALPVVVDIMGEELGWSCTRKRTEIWNATKFLEMGLPQAYVNSGFVPELIARGWAERIQAGVWRGWGAVKGDSLGVGRARFEVGELDALKKVWVAKKSAGAGGVEVVKRGEVGEMLKEIPGYEGVSRKEVEYVLEEAGLMGSEELDFDDFVEVCGNLKEVAFIPTPDMKKRARIPVEKSGGGV